MLYQRPDPSNDADFQMLAAGKAHCPPPTQPCHSRILQGSTVYSEEEYTLQSRQTQKLGMPLPMQKTNAGGAIRADNVAPTTMAPEAHTLPSRL